MAPGDWLRRLRGSWWEFVPTMLLGDLWRPWRAIVREGDDPRLSSLGIGLAISKQSRQAEFLPY